jgi:periplasmic protein TonB
MTNNELIKSDMLDILFENRNKDYGAYALRRGYDNRMWLSLGIGMSLIIVTIVLSSFGKKSNSIIEKPVKDSGIILKTIVMPEEQAKQPEKPKEVSKPAIKPQKPVAAVKHTADIKIVPDEKLPVTEMPTKEDLVDKAVSTTTSDGEKENHVVKTTEKPAEGPSGTGITGTGTQPDFVPLERNAEYPGGAEALRRFLANNLATPDELESGDKKMVRVRFNVDKEGNISSLQIEMSGGDQYDREVLRVCKKMPRWKPAIQNGSNVAVSYVLPVTFMGLEQ